MQHVGIGAGPLRREIGVRFLPVRRKQPDGFWSHGYARAQTVVRPVWDLIADRSYGRLILVTLARICRFDAAPIHRQPYSPVLSGAGLLSHEVDEHAQDFDTRIRLRKIQEVTRPLD